jgi:hypothetical protein
MSTIALGVPYKDTVSIFNSQLVRAAVQKRFPAWADQAEPYVNILTLKAWNQRGYRVKKGEKAIRVFTKIPVTEKDEKTGEEKIVGSRNARACVFALPQVEKRNLTSTNTHSEQPAAASGTAAPGSAMQTHTPGASMNDTSGTTSASLTL